MPSPIHTEEREGITIAFYADREDIAARDHFDDSATLRGIERGDYAWFSARVTASKDGVELASTDLGCCAYESAAAFVTDSGYYDDMARTVLDKAQNALADAANGITKMPRAVFDAAALACHERAYAMRGDRYASPEEMAYIRQDPCAFWEMVCNEVELFLGVHVIANDMATFTVRPLDTLESDRMARGEYANLTPGQIVRFPDNDASRDLFTRLYKAGFLKAMPPTRDTNWETWGNDQEDGSITATLAQNPE